jgi:protoporphyrinogen oxidase
MKIVVIGLQNAGLLAVKALRKQFKKNLEIVVIERQKG